MPQKIRLGVAQIAPAFFDKPRTIEKTIRWIEEAGLQIREGDE